MDEVKASDLDAPQGADEQRTELYSNTAKEQSQTATKRGAKRTAGVASSARQQGSSIRRPFAVFDIDGTLIRWQLYHAVADRLVKLGFVNEGAFNSIKLARMEWKKRSPSASFKSYELELIKSYEAALLQLTPEQLSQAVESVFDEYKDQVYVYTRQLINDLKARNYRLFAISGSQSEIIDKIAPYYGFEAYVGTEYEQNNGKFTGKKMFHAQNKDVVLKKLIKEYRLDLRGSFAVGDSSGDISMLEMVDNPIAFNPEAALFEHAKRKGWKIVVERKNVIYELEGKNGTYVLA